MNADCDTCPEIKKMEFRMGALDLTLQRNKLDMDSIRQIQESRDIEHETMIQGLTTRMDNMTSEFGEFKKEMSSKIGDINTSVNTRLNQIEKSIPTLFETSVNALLAKIAKWLLISIGVILVAIIIAVTRPVIVKALDELKQTVENTQIIE